MKSVVEKSKIKLRKYTDYRQYLKDLLQEQRAVGNRITNRTFASLAGVNSSSWLTSILQGKKGLSSQMAGKISVILGHDEKERLYFEALVMFNQAKNLEQRNIWFRELHRIRRQVFKTPSIALSNAQYEFYSKWYYTAVRSLIDIKRVTDENIDELAASVSPPITVRQARKALSVLKRLGMIETGTDGRYVLTNSAVTTGRHSHSLLIDNYHRETMELASQSLDRYKPGVRDISTLSVGVSKDTAEVIKKEIALMRRRIIELANGDAAPDRVYHLNFHMFPMSDISDSDEELKGERNEK